MSPTNRKKRIVIYLLETGLWIEIMCPTESMSIFSLGTTFSKYFNFFKFQRNFKRNFSFNDTIQEWT